MACYAFGNGAAHIIAVRDLETAYHLKAKNPDYLLVGERHGQRPDGFDFGNSPTQIREAELAGRTLIYTTSSGTQALAAAAGRSDDVVTGSFVNADAVVRYAKQRAPETVSLLCTEDPAEHAWDEDTLCAEYMLNRLSGKPCDFATAVEALKSHEHGRLFLERRKPWLPAEDFWLCLALNRYDFVLKASPYELGAVLLDKAT